ncbi:hypothetical protein [Mycobacteroides abscessus]|uniref:hypothetical protein n=1 Tax=Mycobacteroides abscessus TaxID=36809 RepID=UPI0012FFF49F|nr:hypothetical protein [Mycobacteroides abscessus]
MMTTPDPRQVPERDTSDWPRELFDLPNDPLLTADGAPHEVNGTMRAWRAGHAPGALPSLLKKTSFDVHLQLNRGIQDEKAAEYIGLAIYDSPIEKGTV